MPGVREEEEVKAKKPKKQTVAQFINTLVSSSKRIKSGVSLFSMRNCRKWGGGDLFILYAEKGTDRFQIVETFVNNLKEDDE